MKHLIFVIVLAAMPVLTGCGSSGGGIWPAPVWILKFGVLSTPEGPIAAGDTVEFEVSWIDGRAPYKVSWDFSDGMEPTELTTSTSESMHAAEVVAVNETNDAEDYQGLVTITDTDGTVVSADFSFTVQPSP